MADIGEEDASYKRGLVLGLTMAEIMILILFILLLLLATLVRDLEEKLDAFVRVNAGLQNEVVALRDQQKMIAGRFDDPVKIDDLFTELKLAKEQAARVPALEEKVAQLTTEREANLSAHELAVAMKAIDLDLTKPETRDRMILSLKKILDSGSSGTNSPVTRLEEATEILQQGEVRIGDLEGQVKNLLVRINAVGGGTEKPACWAEKETGKTEYIFDIAIGSEGLLVRDRKLPHRADAQAQLPLQGLLFDIELSPVQFLEQTRPLYEWSEKNNCRFFVRAFDQTAATEKDLYKVRMRTLEEHFYKYEMIDEHF